MKLWLVRHAAPAVAPGLCYGRSDVPADEQHTSEAAFRLAPQLPPHLAVASSPRQRCMQLAHSLQMLRPELVPTADERIAEMDFGEWELQPWDAVDAAAFSAWERDFGTHAPGGGESVNGFMARVAHAYDAALARGSDALWITHAGVIRAVHLLARGVRTVSSSAQWPADAIGFGECRVIEI